MAPRTYSCDICEKSFCSKSNLNRHTNMFHCKDKSLNIFKCNNCDYRTPRADILRRHLKQTHHKMRKAKQKHFICPLCSDYSCTTDKEIRGHFSSSHGLNYEYETLMFVNFEEFNQWKLELERKNYYQFVIKNSWFKKESKKIQYLCFRNGMHKSNATKRRESALGSNKINGYCPAKMEVSVFDGHVEIEYQKLHVGHSHEINRLRLHKSERDMFAEQIDLNIPFEHILENVKSSIVGKMKRRDLLKRKDLHNIKRRYKHCEDRVSKYVSNYVSGWATEIIDVKAKIVYYKALEILDDNYPLLKLTDFVIITFNSTQMDILENSCICVDSTNAYDDYGFELTTLMVVNDHVGVHWASMFSNALDQSVLETFFMEIKKNLNKKLNPRVFMSGLADHFYNAWVNVMGPVDFRLFSYWHVNKAWQQNLMKIQGGRFTKEKVSKSLQKLLEENDFEMFKKNLDVVVQDLKNTQLTQTFGTYFEKEFVQNDRFTFWPNCYRKQFDFKSNTHLKRMHGMIKYICLRRGKIKRVDIAQLIIRSLRDKIIQHWIETSQEKLNAKISQIRIRHVNSSFRLLSSHILQMNDFTWQVSIGDSINRVTKLTKFRRCSCILVCSKCKCCVHQYICTCPDSSIEFNICLHTHLVIQKSIPPKLGKQEKNYTQGVQDYARVHKALQLDEQFVSKDNEVQDEKFTSKDNEVQDETFMSKDDDVYVSQPSPVSDNSEFIVKEKMEELQNSFQEVLSMVSTAEDVDYLHKLLSSAKAALANKELFWISEDLIENK